MPVKEAKFAPSFRTSIVNVCSPFEVAGQGDTQEFGGEHLGDGIAVDCHVYKGRNRAPPRDNHEFIFGGVDGKPSGVDPRKNPVGIKLEKLGICL